MALAETAKLIAQLSLDDRMSGGLKKASGNLGKFESGLGRVASWAGKVSAGLAKAGTRIAVGVGIGLGAAAKAAIDWEDAFQGVVKTVDASDADLKGLADNLRDMSTRMPTTAIELAAIAEAAGQMGVGFDKATGKTNTATIAAFTEQVAMLAATTDVSAEDAAMALGQLTNVIGLSADEFDNFAAALVDLGNKGSSTESQILKITRRAGGAAKLIGIAKEETLGWSAAAANLGLNQELAGTGLQRFFLQTQAIVTDGGKSLDKLAKTAGMTTKDFQKAFKKNASGALEDLLEGLGKMPKDRRLKAVQDLFGKGTGLTRLIIGLSDSVKDNLAPALDDSAKAWFESAAAAEEFAKRNQTVQSAISRLKNGLIDAAVSVGEGFAPALGRSADKLAEFLRQGDNRDALKDLGKDIGKAIDDVNWDDVLNGAREFKDILVVAFDWAKRIFDVISSLPTEVKAAGLGFLTLDKLSGGLLGQGAAGVVGGLGEALAKSLAASIPVFGKAFVQPVFVTNPGFATGSLPGAASSAASESGGIWGTIGKTIAIAVGAGIAIEAGKAFQQWESDFTGFDFTLSPTLDEQIRKTAENERARLGISAPPRQADTSPTSPAAIAFRDAERASHDTTTAVIDAGDTFDRATGLAKVANVAAISALDSTTRAGSMTITGAVGAMGARIAGALGSLPPPVVNVSVNTNVTASDIVKTTVSKDRQGPQPSRNGGQTWGGGP